MKHYNDDDGEDEDRAVLWLIYVYYGSMILVVLIGAIKYLIDRYI